jgi:hypothetical protein
MNHLATFVITPKWPSLLFLRVLFSLLFGALALSAAHAQPNYTVSAEQLQREVAERFPLRYEPSDQTIRAYQLKFQNLHINDLQPAASELLNVYGPALAKQSLQEVVLHQLRPQDMVVADGLGMQPGNITVTEKGLVIGFVLKPL